VREAVRGKDVVIPLAALVGAPLCDLDPVAATTTNLDAIKLLTSVCSPGQWIIYPNTNSGYGVGEQGEPCTEESPLRPISLYGRTKVEAESAVMQSRNALAFRLATIFGMSPRMRIDLLVNDFVYRAVRDSAVVVFQGDFKRNYIHVRDVARAFVHAIDNFERMKGQVYNVGLDSANLSKLELCERIKRQLPRFVYLQAPIGEDPDQRDYVVLNDKIRATGFEPAHDLDTGIGELIKGYAMVRDTAYRNA
jgi:nucleoside-diphosphate-sugar epimerase